MAEILGAVVNKDLALDQLLARDYTQFLDQRDHLAKMAAAYQDEKRRHGLLD